MYFHTLRMRATKALESLRLCADSPEPSLIACTILRKTIEGYLDSVPSLSFHTIETELLMNAFHSSRYLQSNKSRFND